MGWDPGNVYMLYMQNDGCILIRPSVVQMLLAAHYVTLDGMLRYERIMSC